MRRRAARGNWFLVRSPGRSLRDQSTLEAYSRITLQPWRLCFQQKWFHYFYQCTECRRFGDGCRRRSKFGADVALTRGAPAGVEGTPQGKRETDDGVPLGIFIGRLCQNA